MREQDLYNLLHLSGDQIEGATFADADRLKVLGASRSKPHCALYSWIVLDVIDGDPALLATSDQISALGGQQGDPGHKGSPLAPVLFGYHVEFHSTGEYGKGTMIRTGPALEYDGRGIFETEDTIFVLLGKGYRRPAPVELVNLIPLGVVPENHSIRKREPTRRGIASARDYTDVVYCDLQISAEQGSELLRLVARLRSSGSYPGLESVFIDIERELGYSKQMPGQGAPD
ncbi:DUF6957 family protein [Pseudomonas savastanoi]|uniref:DUF6957 family protein n=1 Tax=Pseudomonas savastanoi TaxID=29438 RepID=UPI001F2D8F29|nr:hypothetical protein [Pseudomonas savastanoi]